MTMIDITAAVKHKSLNLKIKDVTKMRTVKAILFGVFCSFVSVATAQTIDLPSMTGAPGANVNATVSFTAGAQDVASWQIDVMYDRNSLGLVTFPECPVTAGAASPGTIECAQEADGQFDVFRVGMFTAPSAVIGSGDVAIVEFTIPNDAQPGTVFDLTLDDAVFFAPDGTNVSGASTVNIGSVTVECPTGESCFGSSPAPGGTLDLGTEVVGTAATPNTFLTVSNSSSDTTFDVTNFDGPARLSFADTTGGITVPTNGSVDFDNMDQDAVTCTPSTRGNNDGSFTLEHNANNGAASPVSYDLTCTGLAPNVEVPASVAISGLVPPAATPSSVLTVTNNDPGDNATSTANDVSVSITTDPDDVFSVVDGGPFDIPANEDQDFVIQCDNSTTTNSTGQATVSYFDPEAGANTSTTVDLSCVISDTAPVYNSDPVPGSTLTMTSDFGVESPAEGIDVNNANTNPDADDLTISSATADNAVFDVSFFAGPYEPGAVAVTDAIEVTCTPEGVGTVVGTLTVETNDPNEPASGFEYDLECVGTGDRLTSTPAFGGTLSLGSVPPGTQAGPGTIEFSNNLLEGGIELDCTKENDPEGIFTFMQIPVDLEIAPQTTATVDVTAVPPEIGGPFDAVLDCQAMVLEEMITDQPFARATQQNQITVTVSGRPLVIPTMSRWGLVVMSLMLLLVGGLATRRMMA